MKKIKDVKNKLRKYGLISLICLTGGLSPYLGRKTQNNQEKSPTPVEQAVSQDLSDINKIDSIVFEGEVRDIVYQTDTLAVPPFANSYCYGTTIIRNFVPDHKGYELELAILVHEQKHADNYSKGFRSLQMTPSQYAKLCAHDEISANLCQLLTLRYEYLGAPTPEARKDVINKYKKTKFSYYFEAIEKGIIFPESREEVDKKQEWSFIYNETSKMWMRDLWPRYLPSITGMVERYLNRCNPDVSEAVQKKGYEKALKIMYGNIGGVDFRKYMEKDIDLDNHTFEMMDDFVKVNVFKGDKKEYLEGVRKQISTIKKKYGKLTPEIIEHIYVAEGMKSALKDIDENLLKKNPAVVNVCYQNICAQFSRSISLKRLVNDVICEEGLSIWMENKETSQKIVSDIYNRNGLDLSQMIPFFQFNVSNNFFNWKSNSLFSLRILHRDGLLNNMSCLSENDQIMEMLHEMRKTSKKTPTPPKVEEKKRRSDKIRYAAPDFTKPILVSATEEQEQNIYDAVWEFNNIPDVMKKCDLKAQKAYLEKNKDR